MEKKGEAERDLRGSSLYSGSVSEPGRGAAYSLLSRLQERLVPGFGIIC
jgi:hypothetical protein